MNNQPWTAKYCPKTTKEVQGHNIAITELKNYITSYKSQKKKAALVYGGPGVGKTCIVHAIANELDHEVLEVNASDFRNKDGIEQTVGAAAQQMSLFAKSKIMLVDEIDGLVDQSRIHQKQIQRAIFAEKDDECKYAGEGGQNNRQEDQGSENGLTPMSVSRQNVR